jgi:hypothetical protein
VHWYIVGWLAAERGNARLAGSLIARTAARHAIVLDTLTACSDRRARMTAGSMTQLIARPAFSRMSQRHLSVHRMTADKTTARKPGQGR